MEAIYLDSVDQWERMSAGGEGDMIVFKGSSWCGYTAMVEARFNRWYRGIPVSSRPVVLKVDAARHRDVCDRIAADLGIRHESPQVIWLDRDRGVRWHASHSAITTDALHRWLSTADE